MPPEAAPEDSPEGTFGSWRILEVLGEGASGRVLLARRAGLEDGRRVAIKTLRSPSPGALARFELERQALARLEHPAIARLYDAGTSAAGVPYVVLEHVDGEPIDLYCDRHLLPVEARLRLFLEVCGGVQHAHRNLIVHRDLKPDNILVDRDGRPRLLDFGIARLLDAEPPPAASSTTLAAEATSRTPAYASPEQILGRPITTAADVFSLGIVLYELLTGRSPWQAAASSRHELEAAICNQDAEPASRAFRRAAASSPGAAERAWRRGGSPARLARQLRGGLDAILRKALAREPEDRYASVEALARDLQNHLAHLPITARPPSVAVTTRLFLRRHLGAAFAAGLLLIAAGVFLLVLDGQARHLRAERDKAEQTLAFLVEVFRSGTPGRLEPAAGDTGAELSARAILDRAAQRVQNELRGHPEVQATLLDAIGAVYYSLGLYDEAARQHRLALERRLSLGEGDTLETAATRYLMAEALVMGDEPQAAEAAYRQALAVHERLLPDSRQLADNLTGLALALELQGSMKEAITYRQQVVDLTRDDTVGRRLLALGTLAMALLKHTDFEDAALVNDEAYALFLASPEEATIEFAEGVFEVALAMRRNRDLRASPLHERVLKIRRALLKPDHPRLLESEHSAAISLVEQSRWQEARELLDRVVEGKNRQLGPDHLMVLRAENDRALCIGELGDWDEAVRIAERVLERAKASRKAPADLSNFHTRLHNFERRRGRFEAALEHLMRAQKYLIESGKERPALVELMLQQASLEADLGRLEAARGRFELLIGEMRERFRAPEWRIAWAEGEYSRVLALLGRLAEAEALARRSYDQQSEYFGRRSQLLGSPLEALREIHRQRGEEQARLEVEAWLRDPGLRPERLPPAPPENP